MNMAAEANRNADRDYFKHAANRITLPLGRIDRPDHLFLGVRISATDLARFAAFADLGERQPVRLRLYRAETDNMADDVNADLGEQQLADAPDGHAHGSFPRAGAFQNIPRILAIIFND